jgi:hypothetical protein
MTCEIDDSSGTDCQDFLSRSEIPASRQCNGVDIKFNYTFTNIGIACVNIVDIRTKLGRLGVKTLVFDDVYSYQDRQICANESWTIPDRRSSINLCDLSDDPLDVLIDVNEYNGRMTNLTFVYDWAVDEKFTFPFQELSNYPSLSTHPSLTPTMDTCEDCTLTGFVSGGT